MPRPPSLATGTPLKLGKTGGEDDDDDDVVLILRMCDSDAFERHPNGKVIVLVGRRKASQQPFTTIKSNRSSDSIICLCHLVAAVWQKTSIPVTATLATTTTAAMVMLTVTFFRWERWRFGRRLQVEPLVAPVGRGTDRQTDEVGLLRRNQLSQEIALQWRTNHTHVVCGEDG